MSASVLFIKMLVIDEMRRRYPEDFEEGFIRCDSEELRISFYLKLRGVLYHVPIKLEDMTKLGNYASAKYLLERFELLRTL